MSHATSTPGVSAAELALKANIASPALTGNPTVPTASPGDNDTTIANTAFVTAAVAAGGGYSTITGGFAPNTNFTYNNGGGVSGAGTLNYFQVNRTQTQAKTCVGMIKITINASAGAGVTPIEILTNPGGFNFVLNSNVSPLEDFFALLTSTSSTTGQAILRIGTDGKLYFIPDSGAFATGAVYNFGFSYLTL